MRADVGPLACCGAGPWRDAPVEDGLFGVLSMARHVNWLLVSGVFLAFALAVGGGWFYRVQERSLRHEAERDLLAIAQMKCDQIEQWREERRADAGTCMDSSFLQDAVRQWLSTPTPALATKLKSHFESLRDRYGYVDVLLADADGRVHLALGDGHLQMHEAALVALARALESRNPAFSEMHDPGDGPHLGIVAPFFSGAGKGRPAGGIVMVCDAEVFLYPLVQRWPVESETAEVLLVRREAKRVVFLNDPRWQSGRSPKLARPLSESTLPVVRAANGEEGIVRGVDYRGEKVLAALRHVPSSSWFMVAKVDEAEALSVWRQEAVLIVVALITLALTAIAGAVIVWQRRDVAFHRNLATTELALDETRRQVEMHFEESIVGMAIGTAEKAWLRVNQALADMMGYPIEELRNVAWPELTHPDDMAISSQHFQRVMDGETDSYRFEKRFLRKNGEVIHAILSVRAIRKEDGSVDYLMSQFQDITARKLQEEVLRESEERFRGYFDASPIGMAIVGPDRRWQRANPALCDMLGYLEEELQQKTSAELTHAEDITEDAEQFALLLTGELDGYRREKRFLRADGRSVCTVLSVRGVHDDSGHFIYAVKQAQDITASKRAEREMARLNGDLKRSNEELQQFANVASHDLQEPLRMVASYTQLLQEVYGEKLGDEARKWIHYAVDGANRMQVLIQDLLNYSRVTTRGQEFGSVDSHAALGQALANLRVVIQETDAMVTNDNLPEIPGDVSQICQLFQNLVSNAIKYRREGISPHVHVSVVRQGIFWEFALADNGIGIDAKFHDRVFVIFQRLHTRREYPGTGIGLAICRRIVERHGGKIWFESKTGEGTTFHFTVRATK